MGQGNCKHSQELFQMSETILKIKDLSVAYGNKTVLTDVNLEVFSRDFIGVIGPNGGGKTTLLKVILGLLAPKSGSVEYFREGKPCSDLRMGYMPQQAMIDRCFPISVREVLLSGLNKERNLLHGLKDAQKQRVKEIEEYLGLSELSASPISQLSGGQLQRTLLGRALVSNPELLILDEPNTYIDKFFERKLYNLLGEMNSCCAIIVVSHDIGTVIQNVKSIACVEHGLDYHSADSISKEQLEESLGCPFEAVAHGTIPHCVLPGHEKK